MIIEVTSSLTLSPSLLELPKEKRSPPQGSWAGRKCSSSSSHFHTTKLGQKIEIVSPTFYPLYQFTELSSMSVIHLSSLFNTFLFWQKHFWKYHKLVKWSIARFLADLLVISQPTKIKTFDWNILICLQHVPKAKREDLENDGTCSLLDPILGSRTVDDFIKASSQHFNTTPYNIVAWCRDMCWTGWPNAPNIFNVFNIFNATRGCNVPPGPWCATSGPSTQALVQQCCKNEAKRVQHHTTSKMLREKFDHFQIWSNINQHVATYRNRVVKRYATDCAQQCCKTLRWNVSSVWPGLNENLRETMHEIKNLIER